MLHQRKCHEMITLVMNRKISTNRKLVVSKLIHWVQMLPRASIHLSLVKSESDNLRVDSSARDIQETIKCDVFFQISAQKSRYPNSRTASPVQKGSRPYTNYYCPSLKHVYHYTCQCTKTSRRIQICSTRGTNVQYKI